MATVAGWLGTGGPSSIGRTGGAGRSAERLAHTGGVHRAARLARSSWVRLTRWEYWPSWVFYVPVAGYIGRLAVRHGSLTAFTAANPALPAGGFVGESKSEILDRLPPTRTAPSLLLAGDTPTPEKQALAERFLCAHGLTVPVVLKPDAGQRGSGVVVVRTRDELHSRLAGCRVDTILQAFVPGVEFGVFYSRRPSEPVGRILSITEKHLPTVVGDGRRSLERLILDDDRALGMARFHLRRQRARLREVPAAGEIVALGDLGSHCRGALFRDGANLLTPALAQALDEVARHFDGFYFGRFDVRAPSVEAFREGLFTVLELNGVTSEATHIYDPGMSLLGAYRVLLEQWRLAFAIGAENAASGTATTRVTDLIRLCWRYRRTSRLHLQA